MVDLHVYVIPTEFWRDNLNSVSSDAVIEALSAGFVQVNPDIPLSDVRPYIFEQLQGECIPPDFCFLRVVGRSLAKISEKQETMLKAKSFLPPSTFSPDIYIIDSRVVKRGNARSIGSNSDGISLPRLTPNQGNIGQLDENYGTSSPRPNNGNDIHRSQNLTLNPEPIATTRKSTHVIGHSGDISNFEKIPDIQTHTELKQNPTGVGESTRNKTIYQQPTLLDQSNDESTSKSLEVKLELAKQERVELEVRRKNTLKKLHELQDLVQRKRKEAYEYWRARFTEEKSRTPNLEDQASALGKDIDNLHKKLVRQLGNNNKGDATLLNRQLQVLKLRQTVDLLKLKGEEGQTKLMCQIRLRNQAETELRAMRAELTQKKVLVQLLKSKLPNSSDIF